VIEVGHLGFTHAGRSGFSNPKKGEGSVSRHFGNGHGHLLGSEIGRNEDFVGWGSSHDHGMGSPG
jgi:hypothetical protein